MDAVVGVVPVVVPVVAVVVVVVVVVVVCCCCRCCILFPRVAGLSYIQRRALVRGTGWSSGNV